MRKSKTDTAYITMAGVIAALYVLLTMVMSFLGLANGAIQIRLSEALTILPVFTGAAVPGLFVGCLLANLLTGCAFWDIVFGSLATLAGALGTRYIGRRFPITAPMFPIVANIIVVPIVLRTVYGSPDSYLFLAATVGIGEILSCGLFGGILYKAIQKRQLFRSVSG